MGQIMNILEKRLKEMGMELNAISPFIRDLGRVLSTDVPAGLSELNQRLRALGWDDLEVDYRTLELATACLEFEGASDLNHEGM